MREYADLRDLREGKCARREEFSKISELIFQYNQLEFHRFYNSIQIDDENIEIQIYCIVIIFALS